MALGIRQEGVYTVYSIPVEWETNQILANHLRMLADEIEGKNFNIQNVRISAAVNNDMDKTRIEFVGFEM